MANVRGFGPDDWPWVLALNAAHETETSKLSAAGMARMAREACLTTAVGEEAFLVAFDQDSQYDSPNFLWFRERFDNFVYVDRVIVAPNARKKGLARALYESLFEEAWGAQYVRVVCEVNAEPPNPASEAFHAKLGFVEIGRAKLANGKTVRYLERQLSSNDRIS